MRWWRKCTHKFKGKLNPWLHALKKAKIEECKIWIFFWLLLIITFCACWKGRRSTCKDVIWFVSNLSSEKGIMWTCNYPSHGFDGENNSNICTRTYFQNQFSYFGLSFCYVNSLRCGWLIRISVWFKSSFFLCKRKHQIETLWLLIFTWFDWEDFVIDICCTFGWFGRTNKDHTSFQLVSLGSNQKLSRN